MLTEYERQIPKGVAYKRSPKLYFGKVLQPYLNQPQSQYGFFQNALTLAIPQFWTQVFLKKATYGNAVTGAITVPGPAVVPVTLPSSTPGGAIIASPVVIPATYPQVDGACKDPAGFWPGLFKLMATVASNTTITLVAAAAMGLTYVTSIRAICPALEGLWYSAGIAFEAKIKAKQVDDHDYAFMMMSQEIDRLIKTTMVGIIPLPAYPVIGGVFSGTINFSMFDYSPGL